MPLVAILALLGWVYVHFDRRPLATPPRTDASRHIGHAIAPGERASAIRGTVTDRTGRRLQGVVVCAEGPDPADHLSCATTGNTGGYAISGMAVGAYLASASALGFRPSSAVPITLEASEESVLDFVLERGGIVLQGSVEDMLGAPIPGATISVVDARSGARTFGSSNADGRFLLPASVGTVTVAARAHGYAIGWRAGLAPDDFFDIHLLEEAIVWGRVLHTDGSRVEDATVLLYEDSGSALVETAFSSADGVFEFSGLWPGRYRIRASKDNMTAASDPIRAFAGRFTPEARIELRTAVAVRGRVLQGPNDAPCNAAEVVLFDRATLSGHVAESGRDGHVVLSALQPGTYDVYISCDPRGPATSLPPLLVDGKGESSVVWRVPAGSPLRGYVVDSAGVGVPACRIVLLPTTYTHTIPPRETTVADGSFTFSGVTPGGYQITAWCGPSGRAEARVDVPPEGLSHPVRLLVAVPGAIEGQVMDDSGRPVGEVLVLSDRSPWEAMTSSDGKFAFADAEAGIHRLRLMRPPHEFLPALVSPLTVAVRSGSTSRVVITTSSRQNAIAGRVVDSGGAGVAGVLIAILPEDGRGPVTEALLHGSSDLVSSAEDGRFRIGSLGDGPYSLFVLADGSPVAFARNVRPPVDGVEIKIPESGCIEGTILRRDGKAAAELVVTVYSDDVRIRQTFGAGTGSFRLCELPPDRYHVVARGDDGAAEASVHVSPGTDAVVALTLGGRVAVRGQVTSLATGAPIVGALVVMYSGRGWDEHPAGDSPPIQVRTNETGLFQSSGVDAGLIHIRVWPPDDAGLFPGWMTTTLASDVDLRDIPLASTRHTRGSPGYLGYDTSLTPEVFGSSGPWIVASVQGGAAAGSGLRVGDAIIGVDGHRVDGERAYLYPALTRVERGATLTLELADGRLVPITAE